MKKKVLTFGALCLSAALVLGACGNGSETESGSDSETASESAAETGETVAETEDTMLYAFNYDVDAMVTLGDYKGLTYTLTDTSVSDDEVESQINTTLNAYATTEEITDRAVEDGDTVNIDYEGLLDGVAFDNGSAEGASLTIGSGTFIDGFEDGLIGVEPGKEVALNLTFPDPYDNNPDLAGQDVVFNVTVNYIAGDSIVPELDDEFVAGLAIDGVTTVEDYRTYVREQLQASKESTAEENKQNELYSQAVQNATVTDVPEELIQQYVTEYTSQYEQYATYFGMEMADFLTTYMNQTEEEFDEAAQQYGKDVASSYLVLCAIANAEGIDPEAMYDDKVAEYVDAYGFTDAATLESQYSRDYIKLVIISDEVMKVLEQDAQGVEAAETTETSATETETAS